MKEWLKCTRKKGRIKLSVLPVVESPTGVPFMISMNSSVFSWLVWKRMQIVR